jgi:hypothetical protein
VSKMRSNGEGIAFKSKARFHGKLFLTGNINYNDGSALEKESILEMALFNKIIFNYENNRPIVFLSALVEYGCESLLPHFYLKKFSQVFKDYHKVVIGWPGRKHLYYGFVDEFWQIDEGLTYLRHYTKAFTGMSRNIKNIEKALERFGKVIKSNDLNLFFCEGICKNCQTKFVNSSRIAACKKCGSEELMQSVLGDTTYHKKNYMPINFDFSGYENWLNEVADGKCIGIFARNRKTYGRNLPAEFYQVLCNGLVEKGYKILWLGEKESTLPCIDDTFFDFTTSKFVDDIYACHGLVSRCKATFQAWTASTRLAQATNTPYCLVESYDQIFGMGQEGKRINLLTKDMSKKKIIFANYRTVMENIEYFAKQCLDYFINFIEKSDSSDVMLPSHHSEALSSHIKAVDLWKTI